ncbi:MAG: DUF1801 domain-containing protein [Clostridiaceae bacterium]
MAQLKTQKNDANVIDFIHSYVDNKQKLEDSLKLLDFFQEVTGFEPKMWGDSIIGFGTYHYKSDRSSQEGDWLLVGFSPRKAAISLYVYSAMPEHEYLLENLGKFKMGKACIYVKKLSDINLDVLKEMINTTIDFLQSRYGNK